jgi:hypothetical protein
MDTPSQSERKEGPLSRAWLWVRQEDQSLHNRVMSKYPRSAPRADRILEVLFGFFCHPAFAIICGLLLVALVATNRISIIVAASVGLAWLIAVLWVSRMEFIRNLTVMARCLLVLSAGGILALVANGFGGWAVRSASDKPLAPSGPLTEAQEAIILPALSQYPGHKVLILAGVGNETAKYADQFSYLFRKAKWIVEGPRPARTDRVVLDLHISIDPFIFTHPEVGPIISSFASAGIPHRPNGIHDPNIPRDWIVLWVGAPEGGPTFIPLQVLPGTFDGLR